MFTADAPGNGVILIFSLTHSFTNIAPGSEIPGVPASEMSEMIWPFLRLFMILGKFFFSLNLWFDNNLDLISNFLNNLAETRVSSQRIKSDFFRISISLKVISPKLPMGVGTKYRPFLIYLLWDKGFIAIIIKYSNYYTN